jgi:hypothetical protein
MVVDRFFSLLGKEFTRLDHSRDEDFDASLRYMMNISEDIVDEFKRYREEDKKSDSRFRFWTYVPSVERGASSVVIRWRKYRGRGRRSDPVPTSSVTDYKMPIAQFQGCTRAEKRAIVHAESRFAKIRRLNWHLLAINKAHSALIDIVGGREVRGSNSPNKSTLRNAAPMPEKDDTDRVHKVEEFTENDRRAFRKKLGLNP